MKGCPQYWSCRPHARPQLQQDRGLGTKRRVPRTRDPGGTPLHERAGWRSHLRPGTTRTIETTSATFRNSLAWRRPPPGEPDLTAAPRDPGGESDESWRRCLTRAAGPVRALIKFERWDDILFATNTRHSLAGSSGGSRPGPTKPPYAGKGDLASARLRLQDLKKSPASRRKSRRLRRRLGDRGPTVGRGVVEAAEGDSRSHTLLSDAAPTRLSIASPTDMPTIPGRRLASGDVYLAASEHRLAVAAYQRSLETLPNDVFCSSPIGVRGPLSPWETRRRRKRSIPGMLYEWSGATRTCDG